MSKVIEQVKHKSIGCEVDIFKGTLTLVTSGGNVIVVDHESLSALRQVLSEFDFDVSECLKNKKSTPPVEVGMNIAGRTRLVKKARKLTDKTIERCLDIELTAKHLELFEYIAKGRKSRFTHVIKKVFDFKSDKETNEACNVLIAHNVVVRHKESRSKLRFKYSCTDDAKAMHTFVERFKSNNVIPFHKPVRGVLKKVKMAEYCYEVLGIVVKADAPIEAAKVWPKLKDKYESIGLSVTGNTNMHRFKKLERVGFIERVQVGDKIPNPLNPDKSLNRVYWKATAKGVSAYENETKSALVAFLSEVTIPRSETNSKKGKSNAKNT